MPLVLRMAVLRTTPTPRGAPLHMLSQLTFGLMSMNITTYWSEGKS